MTVISIGLNHRSAPIAVVGALAIPADQLGKALAEVISSPCVNEAVVLSTCNRTEVFVDGERFHDAYHDVRDALAVVTGVPVDNFVSHLVVRYHDEAIEQLFRITAGLESIVLGEHEILGQVRSAWDSARHEGTSATVLDPLFQHALTGGKRVRTETAIGRHTASLSHAAVRLIRERMELDGRRVLLVGSGDVGASIATVLGKEADLDLAVTNRTASRADDLVAELTTSGLAARTVEMERLGEAIASADIIIAATAAPDFVVDADAVLPTDHDRLFLDLALPADIDPAIGQLDRCQLLVLEDLQEFANRGIERRRGEAVAAEGIVADAIANYRRAISAREVAPLLGSLHRRADQIRRGELEHYRVRLAALEPGELEAVEAMSKAIVAKLLHDPSKELRLAAGSPRGERLAEAARELFDLP
jgi:glutamyl-tRNA reductase